MTVIVDYGVGNLFSLESSFRKIGVAVKVSSDADEIRAADKIILPGVGAFRDAADKLFASGLAEVIIERADAGVHILGICLGMQLLLDGSYEYGYHKGLSLIPGVVRPIADVIPKDYKIPHIGWNALSFGDEKNPLFKYLNDGDFVYFVHSFYATECEPSVIATAEYGAPLTAAIAHKNVYGCQFHPEKSGEVGLRILKAFTEL